MKSPNVKWLVEKGSTKDAEHIIDCVKSHGMEVIETKLFESLINSYDYFSDDDCVICYGTLNLIKSVMRKPWIPGVWYDAHRFLCQTYFEYFGKYLLNDVYSIIPIRETIRRKKELYETYGVDGCIYIRPDRGDKPFIGQVVPIEKFDKDLAEIEDDIQGDNNKLCVVSTPKHISAEWRFFVNANGVITGSQYKYNGKLDVQKTCPDEAIDLANEIARIWQPFNVFVIDICKSGDEFRLLEINSACSSGLYDSNYELIVLAMAKAAQEDWLKINEI